jgi:hypothetical protein
LDSENSKDQRLAQHLSVTVDENIFLRAVEISNRVAQEMPDADFENKTIRSIEAIHDEMKLDPELLNRIGMRFQALYAMFLLKDRMAPFIVREEGRAGVDSAVFKAAARCPVEVNGTFDLLCFSIRSNKSLLVTGDQSSFVVVFDTGSKSAYHFPVGCPIIHKQVICKGAVFWKKGRGAFRRKSL